MIGIDWVFLASAGGIVGVALIDKLSEEYGFKWLGWTLRLGLYVTSVGAGLYLFDLLAEVFL